MYFFKIHVLVPKQTLIIKEAEKFKQTPCFDFHGNKQT